MADSALDAAIAALEGSPAFARLLRSLDLAEEFRFHILVGATPLAARALRFLLDRHTRMAPEVLDPYSQRDVLARLLPPSSVGTVLGGIARWVGSPRRTPFLLDGSRAVPEDEPVWRELFRRLNERRNAIARQLPGPLLLVAPEWLVSVFSQEAPDLWSIRSSELTLPPVQTPLAPAIELDRRRELESSLSGEVEPGGQERLERAVAEARERLAAEPAADEQPIVIDSTNLLQCAATNHRDDGAAVREFGRFDDDHRLADLILRIRAETSAEREQNRAERKHPFLLERAGIICRGGES